MITILCTPSSDCTPCAWLRDPIVFGQTDWLHVSVEHDTGGGVGAHLNQRNIIAVGSAFSKVWMQYNLIDPKMVFVWIPSFQIMITDYQPDMMSFGSL